MGRDDEAPDAHARVQWVYQASSREDLEARYDRWARDYDADLRGRLRLPRPAPGDGQGLAFDGRGSAGPRRRRGHGPGWRGSDAAGFARIVGIDMSQGMLDAAQAKGIYGELQRAVLGESLDFPDDHF